MKVLILAAGLGSRLQPLTDNLPKVMLPVGGKPVLEHLINLCHFHGLNEIIISTHYLSEKFPIIFKMERNLMYILLTRMKLCG